MEEKENRYIKMRKIAAVVSLVLFLAVSAAVTVLVIVKMKDIGFSPVKIKEYIQSFGWAGYIVAALLQIMQVLFALIPGEIIESACGFCFGPFFGTLVCYIGLFIGESIVFLAIRKLGTKAISLFTDPDKINHMKFLENGERMKLLLFILFFIPGTPKDLLTYFVPLTKIKYSDFLWITLVARFPSIITSTVGGNFISNGDYTFAIIMYGATALVSIAGIIIYRLVVKKKNGTDQDNDQ